MQGRAAPRQRPFPINPTVRAVRVVQPQAVPQVTQPNRAVRPRQTIAPQRSMPMPGMQPSARPNAGQPVLPMRQTPARKKNGRNLLLIIAALFSVCTLSTCAAVGLGGVLLYGRGILPGVRAFGVEVGGMTQIEAANALQTAMQTVTLRDAETGKTWNVNPAQLGLALDADATAELAYAQGRGEGSPLTALSGVDVEPVVTVAPQVLTDGLENLRDQLETPARNAGVALVDGSVQPTPPENGRALDVSATTARLQTNPGKMLADGVIDLVMQTTTPTVTDSSGMVAAAQALLVNPLTVRVFDPVTGDIATWDVQPETWARWLTADSDPSSSTGLRLSLDERETRAYLESRAASSFDALRYIDVEQSVAKLQQAVGANATTATVRVYHRDRTHTVQSGETIISIAWDYGVPYPWVQQANGGIESLSVGQQITIPSPDNFMEFEPVPDKRIEVSISQQRTRVYENGQLKWDWVSSTGINSSPTWPGLYQIISHVDNAYAANWNLWMPNFMGVYRPIPGADFTNGFHGFPTRGGGQLLWENSLGTKVTYGCILLSNTNIQQLYSWAEEGVVVEITP